MIGVKTIKGSMANAKNKFLLGYNFGKQKGFEADLSTVISGFFGLLIFSYVASTMGPDIIENFTNHSIEGAEGEIFSLGGLLAAAGVLSGVGAMVGFKVLG